MLAASASVLCSALLLSSKFTACPAGRRSTMSLPEVEAALQASGHCSALVKVDGALTDLFMGHSSWFEYANTDRIFKHYHFAFKAEAGANRISFASYPVHATRFLKDAPVDPPVHASSLWRAPRPVHTQHSHTLLPRNIRAGVLRRTSE